MRVNPDEIERITRMLDYHYDRDVCRMFPTSERLNFRIHDIHKVWATNYVYMKLNEGLRKDIGMGARA